VLIPKCRRRTLYGQRRRHLGDVFRKLAEHKDSRLSVSVERSIASHFAALDDPRSPTQSRHKLIEMIIIAIAATLSGADGWAGVETFGKAKEAWLHTFLERPHGIPSHDCFGRVFALLSPDQFAACFRH
jgi:hypothetical protein